ncbi:type II toxin-antitoxin system RelE/ParE family toxin [Cyclobacterium sp.]|jgi:plasmid stabilization system protein ParE|uniref:type II toxin-antitoxin system RelE/ParE family toxin n=1 Tax=Cyclobacterium sp. TaxID=1966343 RepID=UPI0019C08B05|nr:type II toxin-antitoxin system RelE/ParE family toxin [Cyclobacterium sp.]MBD3631175.1 type II toxin-antitoxin system RelE/ParE family toxin [Cyclobacterium sp.]
MVVENPLESIPEQRLKVSWTKSAFISLQKAYKKIKENSPASAEKVKETILVMTRNLPDHPEKYPLDRFKKDNPGNYRALEKYSYRVAYRHTDKEIKILRLRHVKQEPKPY